MATASSDVLVVGGGIVGAACALELQRDGHAVLLIDPGEPERAASWGNAGHFAYEQVLPLAGPGLWLQLPRLLFSPESPLSIPPRSLVTLAPWLLRFAWNTRAAQVRGASAALASLLAAAPEAWRRLAAAADLQALIRGGPMLVVARDTAALVAKRPLIAEIRRHGISVEELGPEAARAIEPMLRPGIAGAFVYPDAQHTIDPGQLTRKVLDAYETLGGKTVADTIRTLRRSGDGQVSVVGDNGSWTARQCVVSAGIGSREILETLGLSVPLAAERGYHLMVPLESGRPTPRVPLIGARPEFVITPMRTGVRLAGTVEIAPPEAPPNWRRARMLGKLAEQIIEPLGATPDASVWMGCRPTLPDSLPVIGRTPGLPAVIGAFGHQHLGLTLAAITAEIVGAIARDRPPPLSLAPYSLSRF